MNETYPRKIAPHLITDTGVWRLTVEISAHNMQAWIRRNDEPSDPIYFLAEAAWAGDDSLRNVENAIYDNPLVLDDFEADIIINTSKFILIPKALQPDTVTCRNAFAMVYGESADDDIFCDSVGEYFCVYMLMPGLRSFLARTFAGARISSQISTLIKYWSTIHPVGNAVMADIKHDSIDIAAFKDGKLLAASRRQRHNDEDDLYFIANSFRLFDRDQQQRVAVYVSGEAAGVIDTLSDFLESARPTPLPANDNVSLPTLICSFRKPVSK